MIIWTGAERRSHTKSKSGSDWPTDTVTYRSGCPRQKYEPEPMERCQKKLRSNAKTRGSLTTFLLGFINDTISSCVTSPLGGGSSFTSAITLHIPFHSFPVDDDNSTCVTAHVSKSSAPFHLRYCLEIEGSAWDIHRIRSYLPPFHFRGNRSNQPVSVHFTTQLPHMHSTVSDGKQVQNSLHSPPRQIN